MNVTDEGANHSQSLGVESLLKKNSAKHKGYAGVYNSSRIAENNIANANEFEVKLLEQILERNNIPN